MSTKDLNNFEKNIGYFFKDQDHLKIALTHKSYIDENPKFLTNQRYEFIGDVGISVDIMALLYTCFNLNNILIRIE